MIVDGVEVSAVAAAVRPALRLEDCKLVVTKTSDAIANRELLLREARKMGGRFAVLCDSDDTLTPDAIAEHANVLQRFDISFGDAFITDERGNRTGDTLFGTGGVPVIAGAGDIEAKNFFGFGNTAIDERVLSGAPFSFPKGIIAADWWFFSEALQRGFTAGKTSCPVVNYRMHGANIMGSASNSIPSVTRQCEAALAHFKAKQSDTEIVGALTRLRAALEDDAATVTQLFGRLDGQSRVWFDDLVNVALRFYSRGEQS